MSTLIEEFDSKGVMVYLRGDGIQVHKRLDIDDSKGVTWEFIESIKDRLIEELKAFYPHRVVKAFRFRLSDNPDRWLTRVADNLTYRIIIWP